MKYILKNGIVYDKGNFNRCDVMINDGVVVSVSSSLLDSDAVTVDFTNPRHNEYLFEIRQNGTMIFRIMGQTLDSGHISFMTWVTQQGHLRRSVSWVRLPAEANAVIRFYRCTNCILVVIIDI